MFKQVSIIPLSRLQMYGVEWFLGPPPVSFLSFPLMNLVCQWLSFHSGIGPSNKPPNVGRLITLLFLGFL